MADKYSTTSIAKNAVNQLSGSLSGLKINDLDSYVTKQLRKDYKNFTDYNSILNKYNAQSDASWDLSRAQQEQAMNMAEAQNYANTKNAVSEMRNALAGSAASGANRGAANATALQAMLGLGQQNAATTTEGMQNYQNTSREAAAARAANAVSSLEAALEGTNSMYDNATSAYGADHTYGVQGVADAYGNVSSAVDTNYTSDLTTRNTNASNEAMNDATNATNKAIAKLNNASAEKIASTPQRSISYSYTNKTKNKPKAKK